VESGEAVAATPALAGRRRAAHALRQPHNWMQLGKFCAVGGIGYILNLGVYWLLKSHARAKSGRADERIGVIATTPLAPNRSLHLVRAGDELILVGATDHSITPLRVYTSEEAILVEGAADAPLQLPAATPSGRESFLEVLRKRTARA